MSQTRQPLSPNLPARLLALLAGLLLGNASASAQGAASVPPAGQTARPIPAASTPARSSTTPVPPATPAAQKPAQGESSTDKEDPNAIHVLLSPELETVLAAPMTGRIAQLNTQLGAPVKKGAMVLAFDCSEAVARLRMADAEYAAARETLKAKEGLRKLEAAGDVEVALAAAAADKAKAAIGVARAQSSQCTLTAPFNGRVAKVHVKPHQGVNVGAPLVELVSDGPLKIRLNVPSRWLRQLRINTPFVVSINETGRNYPAHVSAINARVDAVAQTIELEAALDSNPPELLAGMSGIARFKIAP